MDKKDERRILRALLIEDNDDDADLIRAHLRRSKHTDFIFHRTKTLQEALAYLREEIVDVVVVDLILPDSVGIETFFAVRDKVPHIAIVILSDYQDEDLALRAVEEGAQEYLLKSDLSSRMLDLTLRHAVDRKMMQVSLLAKNRDLLRMLQTDPLTKTLTRRYGLELLDREIQRSSRYGHPFVVLLIDIDDFKQINDDYGHNVGDEALRAVSRYLLSQLRETDLVIRYGGDEFLVLLVNTDLSQAVTVCQKLQSSKILCPLRNGETRPLTLSIGLAVATPGCQTISLIDQADIAMLMAKKNGKGRYHISAATLSNEAEPAALKEFNLVRRTLRQTLCRLLHQFLSQSDRLYDVINLRTDLMRNLGARLAMAVNLLPSEWQTLENAILLTNIERVNLCWEIATREGGLTPEQREIVKTTLLRNTALLRETGALNAEADLLETLYEWYDGSGMPKGLRGEEIPLGGRMLAILSAYALLREGGPHTRAYPTEEALELLQKEKGTHFDPSLLDTFVKIVHEYEGRTRGKDFGSILLVEDHLAIAKILQRRLEAAGYQLVVAATIREAREHLASRSWTAVLVDLMLPDGSGLDLLRAIRSDPATASLPLAVVSARLDAEAKRVAEEVGAFAYIEKPIRIEVLLEILANLRQGGGRMPQELQVISRWHV